MGKKTTARIAILGGVLGLAPGPGASALAAKGVPAPAPDERCLPFAGLPAHMARATGRDPKKIQLEFTPIELAGKPAYVVSDLESCHAWTGVCTAHLYLSFERGCYEPVLGFRGKWLEAVTREGRGLAGTEVNLDLRGGAKPVVQAFRYDEGRRLFVEKEGK